MIKGEINFPGDKSISHRALMIASLSLEKSNITNLSDGIDVLTTKTCLEQCGINIKANTTRSISLRGGVFSDPVKQLNCGNSGTTARLLIGLLASRKVNATFFGDNSLSQRPMDRIVKPLSKMRLKIRSKNGKLPLRIDKSELIGNNYQSLISSAQVKSSFIFCSLGACSKSSYSEPIKSRDHTEIMLRSVGIDIKSEGNEIFINKMDKLPHSLNIAVPGDPSTAAFFAASAVLLPRSELVLNDILANPTRFEFFKVLDQMGAKIECISIKNQGGEQVKDIKIRFGHLEAIKINDHQISSLIDELPILAVVCTQAEGQTIIRGAEELRVKECDRIHAIVHNLRRMGVLVEEYDDGFSFRGPIKLRGAKIKTFNDHRIAMAFTIAGLIANGPTKLDNEGCVAISYPDFFNQLGILIK